MANTMPPSDPYTAPSRTSIPKRLRFEILRRDNYACRYCGATAPDVQLTVDHVVPVVLGGTDDPDNLVTACVDCNAGKSSMPADAALVEDVAQDAIRWQRAMEAAAEIVARDREAREAYCAAFEDYWNGWTYTDRNGQRCNVPLPPNWRDAVAEMLVAGLSLPSLKEAVDTAMRAWNVKDEFRYFIGVGRRLLAQQAAFAAELARRGMV